MTRRGRTRGWWIRRGLALLVVAGLAVWAARWGIDAARPRMAEYWAGQLETATASEAEWLCRRLAALKEHGLPHVAAALASSREPVAQAAANTLADELVRWQRLPAEETSPLLAALAAGLARHVEQYGPTSQRTALRLAEQILRWPTDDVMIDRLRLVADCERVLRSRQLPPVAQRDLEGPHGYSPAPIAKEPLMLLAPPSLANSPPGGGLPIEMVPGLPLDAQPEGDTEASPLDARPQPLVASNPTGTRSLSQLHVDVEEAPADPDLAERVFPSTQTPQAAVPLADDALEWLRESPDQLSIAELFRLADLPDNETQTLALAALRRRGLAAADLELGRRLINGPVAERRLWVERLPRIPSVDARPWLLIASEDPDATVRRTALTLMATAADPRLLGRVSQMAHGDADPELQLEASRILAARAQRTDRR